MSEETQHAFDLEAALRDVERANARFDEAIGKDTVELAREKVEADLRVKMVKNRTDVQKVLKQVEVRRLLFRILEIAGPYRASFVAGAQDVSAFNEGRRDVGLKLMEIIFDAEPGAFNQMQREHVSDIKAEQHKKQQEEQ